jgi:hypothetical protein
MGSWIRSRRITVLIAIVVACLCVPALAAAKITVPPGATEGDQYFEEVPDGGGSGSVNHGGGGGSTGGGGGSSGETPAAATQSLDRLGADGKAAAALANANRPPEAKSQKSVPPPATSSSPSDGEGGMGTWFPLLIALTAVLAGAYALRRRLYPA